jgi:hypothetical protein
MSSKDLEIAQRRALFDGAVARRDWCQKVAERAKDRGWPEGDPVAVAALAAREALQGLVRAVFDSGPTYPTMKPLASRSDVMAARKRGLPEP